MCFRKYTKNLKKTSPKVRASSSKLLLLPYIWLRFICIGAYRYVASLISTVLNRMGAVIREKSVLAAYCVRSLVDTRSVLTGDLQRKKEQGYTKGTVILVRETLKPPLKP